MNTSVTMEQFHALLTSEAEENSLVAALRKLMAIEKPEDMAVLAADEPMSGWYGWGG